MGASQKARRRAAAAATEATALATPADKQAVFDAEVALARTRRAEQLKADLAAEKERRTNPCAHFDVREEYIRQMGRQNAGSAAPAFTTMHGFTAAMGAMLNPLGTMGAMLEAKEYLPNLRKASCGCLHDIKQVEDNEDLLPEVTFTMDGGRVLGTIAVTVRRMLCGGGLRTYTDIESSVLQRSVSLKTGGQYLGLADAEAMVASLIRLMDRVAEHGPNQFTAANVQHVTWDDYCNTL